jgi:Protein of unknown function (DUF4232)
MRGRGKHGRIKEMIKLSRRTVATATAVLALGAGSVTWVATSASAATARPGFVPRCTSGQLAVWVNADSADGTAGTTYYNLDLTNTGGKTCYLYGWPGVSATNSAGRQLGVPAVRNPNVPARIVNVAPGGTAHALLGYVDVQLSPACRPTTATFLKVIPPNTTAARHAYFPLTVCTTRTFDLTIGRIQSGV